MRPISSAPASTPLIWQRDAPRERESPSTRPRPSTFGAALLQRECCHYDSTTRTSPACPVTERHSGTRARWTANPAPSSSPTMPVVGEKLEYAGRNTAQSGSAVARKFTAALPHSPATKGEPNDEAIRDLIRFSRCLNRNSSGDEEKGCRRWGSRPSACHSWPRGERSGLSGQAGYR